MVRLKARFMHFGSKKGHHYDPRYDVTKMLSIKNVYYQKINCETFYKLRSEKFKNTMPYKPRYSGYHGNSTDSVTLIFGLKFMSGTLKESLYKIRRKFIE